jgi:hypothetical protein
MPGTQFTCFTGTKGLYTDHFKSEVYQYKSAKTDAGDAAIETLQQGSIQFTCFTTTKVQKLTQKTLSRTSERLQQGSQLYPPGKKWLVQKYKK